MIGLVLLLAAVGTVGTILLTRSPVAVEPTPTAQPSPSAQASASVEASAIPSAGSQTPSPETPKPDPTPLPGDTFIGYEVTVLEGQNTLFEVDDAGIVVAERSATYARFSKAPVDRIVAPNDLLHWRTSAGFFTGLSYIHGRSGPFLIRKVYQGSDGTKRYLILPDSET